MESIMIMVTVSGGGQPGEDDGPKGDKALPTGEPEATEPNKTEGTDVAAEGGGNPGSDDGTKGDKSL